MIVNPVAALRCAQRRVDYHRQTDRKAPKQTKDYSDNLKLSYFNSRASRSTAEVGLPFMHKAHQLERVTCIREIYKSPVIRLQSGLRDFFFQNAVKNRNYTIKYREYQGNKWSDSPSVRTDMKTYALHPSSGYRCRQVRRSHHASDAP